MEVLASENTSSSNQWLSKRGLDRLLAPPLGKPPVAAKLRSSSSPPTFLLVKGLRHGTQRLSLS